MNENEIFKFEVDEKLLRSADNQSAKEAPVMKGRRSKRLSPNKSMYTFEYTEGDDFTDLSDPASPPASPQKMIVTTSSLNDSN